MGKKRGKKEKLEKGNKKDKHTLKKHDKSEGINQ